MLGKIPKAGTKTPYDTTKKTLVVKEKDETVKKIERKSKKERTC